MNKTLKCIMDGYDAIVDSLNDIYNDGYEVSERSDAADVKYGAYIECDNNYYIGIRAGYMDFGGPIPDYDITLCHRKTKYGHDPVNDEEVEHKSTYKAEEVIKLVYDLIEIAEKTEKEVQLSLTESEARALFGQISKDVEYFEGDYGNKMNSILKKLRQVGIFSE